MKLYRLILFKNFGDKFSLELIFNSHAVGEHATQVRYHCSTVSLIRIHTRDLYFERI